MTASTAINTRVEERPARAKARPERSCAVTRRVADPDQLIRFACDPAGVVTPDIKAKLPGRGVWVGCSAELIGQAVTRRVFDRGFKTSVQVPTGLAETVDRLLETAALQALALANKAGRIVTGQGKVDTLITKGRARLLIQAHDASDGGRRRVAVRFAAMQRDIIAAADEVPDDGSTPKTKLYPPFEQFSVEQLSLALGRSNVVHAAATEGSATTLFARATDRLDRYRSNAPLNSPEDPSCGSDVNLGITPLNDDRTDSRSTAHDITATDV